MNGKGSPPVTSGEEVGRPNGCFAALHAGLRHCTRSDLQWSSQCQNAGELRIKGQISFQQGGKELFEALRNHALTTASELASRNNLSPAIILVYKVIVTCIIYNEAEACIWPVWLLGVWCVDFWNTPVRIFFISPTIFFVHSLPPAFSKSFVGTDEPSRNSCTLQSSRPYHE